MNLNLNVFFLTPSQAMIKCVSSASFNLIFLMYGSEIMYGRKSKSPKDCKIDKKK